MGEARRGPMHIRVGPAGWSYKDWAGQVYPKPQPRGFDPLTYLARYFDAIEINSTFYRIPDAKMTQRWVERVDDHPDFRFTAKLWQGFTHEGTASAQDEAAFRHAMAPLHDAGRLGAVLLQFPYRFHHTPDEPGSTCDNWSTHFRTIRWCSRCAIAPGTARRCMHSCENWGLASAISINHRCRIRSGSLHV